LTCSFCLPYHFHANNCNFWGWCAYLHRACLSAEEFVAFWYCTLLHFSQTYVLLIGWCTCACAFACACACGVVVLRFCSGLSLLVYLVLLFHLVGPFFSMYKIDVDDIVSGFLWFVGLRNSGLETCCLFIIMKARCFYYASQCVCFVLFFALTESSV